MKDTMIRRRLEVTGQVQGVGFRPFVFNLGRRVGLGGFVTNTPGGALIEIEGAMEKVDGFIRQLHDELPPLAKIDQFTITELAVCGEDRFVIHSSRVMGAVSAEVTIDTAVCGDCLREMLDPADRRYRYPFINCTNCGPRYTIVKSIPYDRPNTTMSEFAMCSRCLAEYENPADRRFHAQPIACPECGPHLFLQDKDGKLIEGDPIVRTCEFLRAGKIVAIKGLGGFHLAADGTSEEAIRRLRRLKKRDFKPFALMVGSIEAVEEICKLDEQSRLLLMDIARPIVLLGRKSTHSIAQSVAPGLDSFGVMLPYTPYHYLLFAQGLGPLVMTSGNLSDEPIVKDNDKALDRLGGIADLFLMHDRPIYRRVDDTVLQARESGLIMMRRSRGFVPGSLELGINSPKPILAVGAELKNTVALVKGSKVYLSEHLGDLKDPAVYDHFRRTINHLSALFDVRPEVIVTDLHPEYLSTQYALEKVDVELILVQHHHAHVVSCMAEHRLFDRVIGISADGVGLGTDNAIWGCEVMVADRVDFTRVGHLDYFYLPGSDAAAKQTFRPGLGLLYQAFGDEAVDLPIAARICPDSQTRKMIFQMIQRKINSPPTSSLGRLFDGIACLLGIASMNHFEGQAPMLLESHSKFLTGEEYPFGLKSVNDVTIIDVRSMIREINYDLDRSVDVQIIASKFHNTVAGFLTSVAIIVSGKFKITDVVLSGGCFGNRNLSERMNRRLSGAGLRCFQHQRFPCNDGGIALGQAAIVVARLNKESRNLCALRILEK
ncbi:MAG: carbamoyltransferase HypF [Phycisphaerae bacterium]